MGIKNMLRKWLELGEAPIAMTGEQRADQAFFNAVDGPTIERPKTVGDGMSHAGTRIPRESEEAKNVIDGAMALAGRAAQTPHERTTKNKKVRLDRDPVIVDPTDMSALLGSLKR